MSSGPWGLIATYFNSLGKGISESEKARQMGQYSSENNRTPGMVYQRAPEMDQSNFEAGSPSTVGSNLIGDFGKQLGSKILGGAIQGEKDMYSPSMSSQGGYMLGSTDVDSSRSQSPYSNSAIARYLGNYGGYRL